MHKEISLSLFPSLRTYKVRFNSVSSYSDTRKSSSDEPETKANFESTGPLANVRYCSACMCVYVTLCRFYLYTLEKQTNKKVSTCLGYSTSKSLGFRILDKLCHNTIKKIYVFAFKKAQLSTVPP